MLQNWKISTAAAFVAVAVTHSGCNCEGEPNPPPPPDDKAFVPPAPLPTFPTQIAGVIIDGKTELPLVADISVKIFDGNGNPRSDVRDGTGAVVREVQLTAGVLTVNLPASTTFPTTVRFVVSAGGYASTSVNVDLAAEGSYTFAARLASIAAPPTGTSATRVAAGSTNESGETQADITVETPPEEATQGTASVEIPAETVLTTEDGTPLQGEVEAELVYFNNQETDSLVAFPGGLSGVTLPTGEGDATAPATFVSGGFTAVTFRDENGNVAANLSQPVTVKITVPADTINPATNEPVKVGDVVPAWSYDENTGVWTDQGLVTLESGENGNLVGPLSTTHFSYFNLDWAFSEFVFADDGFVTFAPACNVTVNLSGNRREPTPITLTVARSGGGFAQTFTGITDSTVELLNLVRGQPNSYEAFVDGVSVGQATDTGECGSVNLSVNVPAPPVSGSVTVTVSEACADGSNERGVRGQTVFLTKPGTTLSAATDDNGSARFASVSGGDYTVLFTNARTGEAVSQSITVDGDETVEFGLPVTCDLVTGAVNSDP